MAYMDNAGLYRKYGTEKTTAQVGGEPRNNGEVREIDVRLDLTTLLVTNGGVIVSDTIFFPTGVRVEEIAVITETAATGATATLNLGLIAGDRTTEIDFNGFLAAYPLASMDVAGEKNTVTIGSTGAGALIGTTTSHTTGAYICADYDTAAFTAGVVRLRIRYYRP